MSNEDCLVRHRLAILRDALLSELLSGELSVSAVELEGGIRV